MCTNRLQYCWDIKGPNRQETEAENSKLLQVGENYIMAGSAEKCFRLKAIRSTSDCQCTPCRKS